MEERKIHTGLRLSYDETEERIGYKELNVRITVDRGLIAQDLIVNPFVKELIKSRRLKRGYNLGKIKLRYSYESGQLKFISYYPYPINSELLKYFAGTGIAQTIESRVIKEAKKRFRKINSVAQYAPSTPRYKQLEKRGLTINEIYEKVGAKRFENRLRAKTAADLVRARNKRKTLTPIKKPLSRTKR